MAGRKQDDTGRKPRKKSDSDSDDGNDEKSRQRRSWWSSLRRRPEPERPSRRRPRSPPPPPRPQDDGDDEEEDNDNEEAAESDDPATLNHPPTAPTLEDKDDIYSHSRRAPPRSRSPPPRSVWNIFPASLRRRVRANSTTKKPRYPSPPPSDDGDSDPSYPIFDAAKDVRPRPRRVKSVPSASERAARIPTPPGILKNNSAPRTSGNIQLPAPTPAERNWRNTITHLPLSVTDAILKERVSVDFDRKARIHDYYDTDPILLTDTTTPERIHSPAPQHTLPDDIDREKKIENYPSHDSVPSSTSDPNNFDTATSKAVDREGIEAFAKKPLQKYKSLLEGEEHPPKPRPRRRRRFASGELRSENVSPTNRSLTQYISGSAPAPERLRQLEVQQEEASGSGEPISPRSKSRPPSKNIDRKDYKDGGDENEPKGHT
ncbi:hypothetical protein TWF281_009185 [Arthrobotrys megalospora]